MSKRTKLKGLFNKTLPGVITTTAPSANLNASSSSTRETSNMSHKMHGPSPSDLTVAQQVRNRWKANRPTILASVQMVLNIAEKGLDGLPVYGPKAAVGAAVEVLRVLRLMDENEAAIDDIVNRVEKIVDSLVQFTPPSLPSTSAETRARIFVFNEQLDEIKVYTARKSSANRNVLARFVDAERTAKELGGVWTEIQLAYSGLIAGTVISTEGKVENVQAELDKVQVQVSDLRTTQTTQIDWDLLNLLQPVKSAFYDSHGSAPACLEGTRTQLLCDVLQWMQDPSAKRIYWLTGVAGTGKTTIAQSVAAMAEKHQCLAATFFFSRTADSAERRRAAAVVPTLAYQLAYRHETLREALCLAISSDRDVHERVIASQTKTLLSDALANIKHVFPLPLLVVLDALDECDKENGREGGDLIPIILRSLQALPFSVKIFVTSRPEASIVNMFGQSTLREATFVLALHRDIEQEIVQSDIERYLRHELNKLADERDIPLPFPSDEDFKVLVDRAGALFIYVRTMVMYIASDVGDPVEQLANVLSPGSSTGPDQFSDLDVLYAQMLTKASEANGRGVTARQQFRDVLATIVLLHENIPVAALAILAGVREQDCKKILRCLSSLLLYEHGTQEPVRLVHPSFPDFIIDSARCIDVDYVVQPAQYYGRLALRCLQVMNGALRKNICNIEDPSLCNSEVLGLDQRLHNTVSDELRYAVRFWHRHLMEHLSMSIGMTTVLQSLDQFCSQHLLHWLELLSLLHQVPIAQRGLSSLLGSFQDYFAELDAHHAECLLGDLRRTLEIYYVPISGSALHVYQSALVTMPSCRLWKSCAHDRNNIPALVTKRNSDWNSGMRTFGGDMGRVSRTEISQDNRLLLSVMEDGIVPVWNLSSGELCVTLIGDAPISRAAFSRDGSHIATASSDCIVRVWHTLTGSTTRRFEGHGDAVRSVAFSPYSTLVASGSGDHTVRIWNTATGETKHILSAHKATVNLVTFSPNGKRLASASHDHTIRVWDPRSGVEQRVLDGHMQWIQNVLFLPDSTGIISASRTGVIHIWDLETGMIQHRFQEENHGLRALSCSPDGKQIVAGYDNGLRRWAIPTAVPVAQDPQYSDGWQVPESWTVATVFSDDGQYVATASDQIIRVWDKVGVVVHTPPGHKQQVTCGTFSPNGTHVATSSKDHTVIVWSAQSGEVCHRLVNHEAGVNSVAFSPDGRLIVSGSADSTVRVWDIVTGTEYRVLSGHTGEITCVAFSSDGTHVASCAWDHTVRVWNITTGAAQHMDLSDWSKQPFAYFSSAVFSSSGHLLAACMREGIYVWNTSTGVMRHVLRRYQWFWVAHFSFDDRYIAAQASDGSVDAVWDLDTGELITSVPEPTLMSHFRTWSRFNQDGDGWLWYTDVTSARRRVCWLPPERRRRYDNEKLSAEWEWKVCLGSSQGGVTILDFAGLNLLA